MLNVPAPFPQVGSFALLVDSTQPIEAQRAELVRILRIDGIGQRHAGASAAIAFPLRTGAGGNRTVNLAELIDPTTLTTAEERELTGLQDQLRGRARPNKAKVERAEALRTRQLMADLAAIEFRKLDALHARTRRRDGASAGAFMGRHAA